MRQNEQSQSSQKHPRPTCTSLRRRSATPTAIPPQESTRSVRVVEKRAGQSQAFPRGLCQVLKLHPSPILIIDEVPADSSVRPRSAPRITPPLLAHSDPTVAVFPMGGASVSFQLRLYASHHMRHLPPSLCLASLYDAKAPMAILLRLRWSRT